MPLSKVLFLRALIDFYNNQCSKETKTNGKSHTKKSFPKRYFKSQRQLYSSGYYQESYDDAVNNFAFSH